MRNQEPSKVEEIILSKGDKKFKFAFQLINKDEMLIKAEEEKEKDEIIPESYEKVVTINDLPKRKGIVITDMNVALDQIIFFSKNNKFDFELEDKKNIKLYFYYFQDKDKEEINIPFAYNTHHPEIIQRLSSKLTQTQKSFEKVFNKIKALESNISSAKAFNIKIKNKQNFHNNLFINQKQEIENIINELKNYINNQITLNKNHSEDNFNEIKAQEVSILNKLDRQSSSVEEENRNRTNQIAHLNTNLNTQISSIHSAFKQKNEEIINKLLTLDATFKEQNRQIIGGISKLDTKFSSETGEMSNLIREITHQQTERFNVRFTQEEGYIDSKLLSLSKKFESKIKCFFEDKEILNKLNKILINQINLSFCLNKLKLIKTIQIPIGDPFGDPFRSLFGVEVNLCILKDKRLVSAGCREIIVYNHSYQPQIKIQRAHDDPICSLCGLRNGDLASASQDIKIWRIRDNDYQLIHTLKGHTERVNKVIELEDGRIASCSDDKTIKIWDNNTYECIQTLTGHTHWIRSIIEMNDCIISVSKDKTLRKWNKSTYECVQIIQNVYCCSRNGLEKLDDNTVLVGGENVIYVVDIQTYKLKQLKDQSLGYVRCFRVIRNNLVLFGNDKGEIFCYNPSSKQIISKSKFHNKDIYCLIETEDNQLISSLCDGSIKIYDWTYCRKNEIGV